MQAGLRVGGRAGGLGWLGGWVDGWLGGGLVGWLARGLVVGGACKCPCCASGCASARASAHAGKRAGSQVLSELARCVRVVRASGACRVRVRVGSVRARACRETTGPGPCGVKRHRLGIGTVDGRSLWTGVWLCGRAEEGQRPVTAHGCSGCPLWQPCAATGRWHDCMIGTSGPCAPGECSLKAWVLTKNTVPKTKTLAFSLNSVAEDRFRKSKNRAVRNVPENLSQNLSQGTSQNRFAFSHRLLASFFH